MSKRSLAVSDSLKAAFKEEARRIIRADRAARVTGVSQNTIGAIANALERAFKMGRDNPEDLGAPDRSWDEIPPRGRDALSDLGFWARLGGTNGPARPVRLVAVVNEANKLRWISETERPSAREFPSVAINPLVRLGLLSAVPGEPHVLELSATGLAAYDLYWARSRDGDMSLPLMGMRPTKWGG